MVTVRQAGGSLAVLAAGAVLLATVSACSGQVTASGTVNAGSGSTPTSNANPVAQQGTPAAAAPAAPAAARIGACRKADLSAQLGAKQEIPVDPQGQLGAAGTHYSIPLEWTNISQQTCTMTGFGGVDIDGPSAGTAGGPTYSLPRTADTPAKVTLQPGGKAHTVIQYIDSSGSAPASTPQWTPSHLEVTAPNDTQQLDVPWTAGTSVYQDPQDGVAAASISPVTAG